MTKNCTLVSPLLNGAEFTLSVAKNVALFETVCILRTVKWGDHDRGSKQQSTVFLSWRSGQNERVFLVFDRSSSAWRLFVGNIHGFSIAIPYATVARARDCESTKQNVNSFPPDPCMLDSPGFFLPDNPGRMGDSGEKDIAESSSACSSMRLSDSTDTSLFSEGSTSGDDRDACTSSTRNSTSDPELQTLASVRAPKVRPLSLDSCLLCEKQSLELTFRAQSWRNLHQSAEIRRDGTYFLLQEHGTTGDDGCLCQPRGMYHKRCYTAYTSKRNLQFVQSKTQASSAASSSQPSPVPPATVEEGRRSRSKTSSTDLTKCLFCQKKRQPLRKCATLLQSWQKCKLERQLKHGKMNVCFWPSRVVTLLQKTLGITQSANGISLESALLRKKPRGIQGQKTLKMIAMMVTLASNKTVHNNLPWKPYLLM